ncbi:stemphyloxin II biosynthesis cluster transcription factor sthR [Parastagonospora nodorum]|nr:stemphyloxin II biosynthesis cluster transcription factor sthR [Parastagonospora nodorum]KAH4057735.1 stemphyloxin II biosynthesis cluster transcription factor sthR [Parastagonospora nodorum]KAH4092569.1 stemphyloxin II biosynthesis cluster transcription factor sthR [Parastagonospora nodorum]KAH4128785.1 stemphyloxin II biosynthesis cluster transcription factor sthR [Parastagonospora nodorum]KAH4174660.1 stemphyloxin II biosynthesis cluster transcription factor sthR [Parastagonospora nodorum
MSTISFFATSKRTSCDRCRKQKLRCPPDKDDMGTCGRCLRAGVACATSYTKPRGRSQKHGISTDGTSHVSGLDMQEPALPTPESVLSAGLTSSVQVAEDGSQLWSPLEEYNHLPSLSNFESGALSQSQDEDFAGLWWSPLHEDLDLDVHMDPSGACQNGYSAEISSFSRTDCSRQSNDCSPETLQHVECDMRLSQLNLELCRQSKAYHHWPNTTSDGSVRRPHFAIASALRDLLQNTEAFIHILHCLRNGTELNLDGRYQEPISTHDTSVSPPSLAFPSVLNLTLCFFRIVDLFNVLLSSLALESAPHSPLQRRSSSSSVTSALQILPGLKLAGLAVQEVSLQTKILVLTITHHFETMERLLGLPADLRVSECKDDNGYGLLGASWTSVLSSGRRERFEFGWRGTGNWVTSIESLKANMEALTKGSC